MKLTLGGNLILSSNRLTVLNVVVRPNPELVDPLNTKRTQRNKKTTGVPESDTNDGSYAPSGLYNRRVLSDSGNGSNRKELGKHATPLLVETWMKGAACKRLR